MDAPSEFQPIVTPHKTARIVLLLGGILGVALLGWLIARFVSQEGGIFAPSETVKKIPPSPTKEEMFEQMSTKNPDAPVVSAAEKEKLYEAMSQQVTPPTTTNVGAPSTSVQPTEPAPVVTPAERQKLLDAMQQKAP